MTGVSCEPCRAPRPRGGRVTGVAGRGRRAAAWAGSGRTPQPQRSPEPASTTVGGGGRRSGPTKQINANQEQSCAPATAARRSYRDPPIKGGQSSVGSHVTEQFQLPRRIFWISGVTQRTLIEGEGKKGSERERERPAGACWWFKAGNSLASHRHGRIQHRPASPREECLAHIALIRAHPRGWVCAAIASLASPRRGAGPEGLWGHTSDKQRLTTARSPVS